MIPEQTVIDVTGVTDVFTRQVAQHRGGAALCVMTDDGVEVDEDGGFAVPPTPGREGIPWRPDTLADLASATKAMSAASLLLLVERGRIRLEDTIAQHWPAFGAEGKQSATTRQLLAHQVGVVTTTRPITPADQHAHDPIVTMLAAQAPDWEPGTRHGYHGVTFGWLVSGLIQAVTGRTLFDFYDDEIRIPRRLDLTMRVARPELARLAQTLPPTDEQIAQGLTDPAYATFNAAINDPGSLAYRATFGAIGVGFDESNSPEVLTMPDPSGGGHGTARGLAGLYAALAGIGTTPLLSSDLVAEIATPQATGPDAVLGIPTSWGLGFMLPGQLMWPARIPGAFGHGGASGALGFCDPVRRIAFGFVPSAWLGLTEGADPRAHDLTNALDEHARPGG